LKWRLAIVLAIVFSAGMATGLFAGARHARQIFAGKHQTAQFEGRMRDHFKRQLELTPEQYEKVAPILDEMGKKLAVIREETGTRVTETMQQSHAELAPLLTEAQRAKLEEMKKRHRHILRVRGDRGDRPPPRGR